MAKRKTLIKKNRGRQIMKYLSLVLLILLIITIFMTYNKLSNVWVQKEFAESLKDLRTETPTGAVILAAPHNKETIEYYGKRTAYLDENDADYEKLATVYLSETLPRVKGKDLYILVTISDLRLVNKLSEYKDLDIRTPVVTSNDITFEITEHGLDNTYQDNETNSTITLEKDDDGDVKNAKIIFSDGKEVYAKYLIEDSTKTELNPNGEGCLYSGIRLAYFDETLCNTLLVKMLTAQEIPGLELIYDTPWMKVYKVI